MIETNKYSLTIDESNALKGILILLVIAGHISNLMPREWHFLLYSFHVTSFLFLPFLFQKNNFTTKEVFKDIKRYYIPYIYFFIISLILYTVIYKTNFSISNSILALFMGNATYLNRTIGISAFWFFPTLLMMLFFILLYNTFSNYKKYIFIVSLLFHFTITTLSNKLLSQFPFSLYICLYLFSIGIIIKYIYYNNILNQTNELITISLFILFLFIIYGDRFDIAYPFIPNFFLNPLNFLSHDFVMIFGFYSLIIIAKKIISLKEIGVYSLALYTIHPFVLQLVYIIEKHTIILPKILIFVLVIFISYVLTRIVYFLKLNNYVYPR